MNTCRNGSIGYQINGDAAGSNYDNVIYGDVGLSANLNDKQAIGVEVNYSQAARSTADDYLDVTGYMNTDYDKQRDLILHVKLGLTDSAPDFGAGVNFRYYY